MRLLCALLALLATLPAQARRPRLPFPSLTIKASSPYKIGKKHGKVFRKQIASNVQLYLQLLQQKQMRPTQALSLARRFMPVLRKHAPHLLREMQGIAKGSGCSLDQILLLNARTELIRTAEAKLAGPTPNSLASPGCTSMAAIGRGGKLVMGQNWDWQAPASKNTVLLRIHRKGKPSLTTLTEAGMVGKIGFNSNQLGVCLNFLRHKKDRMPLTAGLPVHVMLRLVMESSSLGEAVKMVRRLPRSAGANYLLGQQSAEGARVVDLETTATKTCLITPGNKKHLLHANHYLSAALKQGCENRNDPTTLDRQRKGDLYATQLKLLDPLSRTFRVLKSRGKGTPISRPMIRNVDKPEQSGTVASIVMDLSSQGYPLHVTKGAPHQSSYRHSTGP